MQVMGNSLMNFHKYTHITTMQIKKQNIASVDENVGQLECSYAAGGNKK